MNHYECGHPEELHVLPGWRCPRLTEDLRVFARVDPDYCPPPDGDGFYGWIRWREGRLVLLAADDTVALDVPLGRVRSLCGMAIQDRERILNPPAPEAPVARQESPEAPKPVAAQDSLW